MNDRNQAFKMTKDLAEMFIRELQDHKGDIGHDDIRRQVGRAVKAMMFMRPFGDASGISTASQEILVSDIEVDFWFSEIVNGPSLYPR